VAWVASGNETEGLGGFSDAGVVGWGCILLSGLKHASRVSDCVREHSLKLLFTCVFYLRKQGFAGGAV
jgi:hypothetical protein